MLVLGLTNAAIAGTVLWVSLDNIVDGSDLLIYDGATGDSNSNLNVITWIGTLGNWDINVSTGLITTYGANGAIDFNSVNHSTGAGDLYMAFSANGFGPASGGSLIQNAGGTTNGGGGVEFISTAGNNTISPFINWSQPWVYQTFTGSSFSGDASTNVNFSDPYNLTQWAYIHHRTSGTTSFDAT